ncbi:TIGR02679 family protein [Kitasatospora phosalacinea]|uniref:TIGR02679 family protein n=1 Tax=Kitasatospora phosalacinea TaxID=2065 RepID=A0A9W6PPZ0_9ACTN|nr:TIGR02679 family protein [Kitasatospora phosalacinea]GLW58788.1 hypothetical protein Kpho01_67990 [Kitasatospora phosalacinea]
MTAPTDPRSLYGGPQYQRLLAAARRSLERTGGRLDGSVSITAPTDAEREALIGITGAYRPPGTARITVKVADLEAAVQAATGTPLAALLTLLGGPLVDRPGRKEAQARTRAQLTTTAEASPLHAHSWYRDWLAAITTDGTLTSLINKNDSTSLTRAIRVLEHLYTRPGDAPPLLLPVLAEATTGDTKALNHGSGALPTLVLRALAQARNTTLANGAEARRELWDSFDVIVDDLASRVLVLNLPAHGEGLGEWLTGAARYGTPFHISLHQLVTLPISLDQPTVYACENPAVLRRAAGELGPKSPPLVCAEGRPSTAFHRLTRAIRQGGGTLHYHGDFDWSGIDMTNQLISRYQARPWHMTAADYLAGTSATNEEDQIPLNGKPYPTPWDPQLAEAMHHTNRALYEEAVADTLLDDLMKHPSNRQGAS